MRAYRSNVKHFGLMVSVASILLGSARVAAAEDPGRGVSSGPPRTAAPKVSGTKLFSLEMRNQPWRSVLEWLADQTGTPFIGSPPPGTFTFVSPKGRAQQYSLAQIVDILNEALTYQKYLLVRRQNSFTLVPTDEKLDPTVVRPVRLEDLEQYGNSEPVSVLLPLTSLVARDAAADIKKMLGPFGEVVVLEEGNQLLVQDTAGNLKRIGRTLVDIQSHGGSERATYAHGCKYVKAADAVKIVKDLLGEPRPLTGAGAGFGRGQAGAGQPPASRLPIRPYFVATDERTNAVLVSGSDDQIARTREILSKIDVPAASGQLPVPGERGTLKSYAVPAGYAAPVARLLQEAYKGSGSVRISPVSDSSILVYADPETQRNVVQQLTELRGGAPPTESRPPQRPERGGGNRPLPTREPPLRRGDVFDIFLKGDSVTSGRPSVAAARFDGYQAVADARFLRFVRERGQGETFLIQPAEIAALRTRGASRGGAASGGGPVSGDGSFPAAGSLPGAAPRESGSGQMADRLFDRLANGKEVWLRSEITDDRARRTFDRIAESAGIKNAQITRQQLRDYLQQHAAAGPGRGFSGVAAGAGPGFFGAAMGAQPPTRFGAARANPVLEKLDRIEEELRKIEKVLSDKEKSKARLEDGKTR